MSNKWCGGFERRAEAFQLAPPLAVMVGRLDPRHLVFIDEAWIKTSMAPLRGWGPKGVRVPGFAPRGHRRATSAGGLLKSEQRFF